MSAFDELKKMLGLEMSDQDKADLYNRSGLVPEPPPKEDGRTTRTAD
jgi:hypothetical protein